MRNESLSGPDGVTLALTLGDVVTSYWSGYSFRSDDYTESGVPVLTKGDIKPRGAVEHGGKFVAKGLLSNNRVRLTDRRDLMITTRDLTTAANFLGLVARAPREEAFAVNQGVTVFRVDEDRVDPRYLVYWCEGPAFRSHIKGRYAGATQIHIRHVDVMAAPVRLPPMPIQRRIASILGAYDDLIAVNRRRIAVLEEVARRVFEEWFVHFRYPGSEEVHVAEGQLPKDWKQSRVANVAIVNGDSLKPASAPQRIGYVDIASVAPGTIEKVEWMAFEAAPGRARRRVKDGSVIWSMVRPNRRSFALVLDPEPDTIVSTGFAVLDAHGIPFSYLYQWVTTDKFVKFLTANATGAAYPAVTSTVFERASIVVPPRDLLQRFERIVQPLLRQAAGLRRTNAKLTASRDLILPRLVSGDLGATSSDGELTQT